MILQAEYFGHALLMKRPWQEREMEGQEGADVSQGQQEEDVIGERMH
jgi:hypothetical protein